MAARQRTELLKPDPPVRGDGKCAICPKPRRKQQSSYARSQDFELDPFCSRECCERFHGLEAAKAKNPGFRSQADDDED